MPIVFITGGARRIGKGLSLRFGSLGWSVGIIYHTSEDAANAIVNELQSEGCRCMAVKADVADSVALEHALQVLYNELGNPDVVVSNAGIFPPQREVGELSLSELRKTLAVNTEPLFTIASWLKTKGVDQGKVHRLISISSLGAFEIWKDRVDYNMSKSALVNLVRSLARSLAPTITVNSVAPGAIVIKDEESQTDGNLVSVNKIPMGRYGTPDDIFDAVLFFATATPYITGQVLVVDGGYQQMR